MGSLMLNKHVMLFNIDCLGDFLYLYKGINHLAREISPYKVRIMVPEPVLIHVPYLRFEDNVVIVKEDASIRNRILQEVTYPLVKKMTEANPFGTDQPHNFLGENQEQYIIPVGISFVIDQIAQMSLKYYMISAFLKNKVESKSVCLPYDWATCLDSGIKYNEDKQNELYDRVVGKDSNQDYILVNGGYGGGNDHNCIYQSGKTQILHKDNEYALWEFVSRSTDKEFDKIVYFDNIEGYTLFDWKKVITNAKCILSMETSLFYAVDVMLWEHLNPPDLFSLTRWIPAQKGYDIMRDINFKSNWIPLEYHPLWGILEEGVSKE